MSRHDRLPPGPNPREDQMTEKDQRQLRETQRGEGERRASSGEEVSSQADLAEGERSEEPSSKMARTPGQAEGERQD